MGAYKYINELRRHKQSEVIRYLQRIRTWEYRQQIAIVRCTQPSNPEKAHRLGYKAKQGYSIFRVRVKRGDRKRPNHRGIVHGKPKNQGIHLKKKKNLRSIAEGRVGRKATNLRVLNSYEVARTPKHKWFEIIMVDPWHNAIRNDPKINWIASNKNKRRECRGLTAAGRKHRGMKKGHQYNGKMPSVHANLKRRDTTSLRRYR